MSHDYKKGDRVFYQYARLKGTIRESRLYTNEGRWAGEKQYRLDWDYDQMSPTLWVAGWQLSPVPDLEQLAEQAE